MLVSFIVFFCFCISLLLALIHSTLNMNIVSTILGLTLLFSGLLLDIFLYLKSHNKIKRQLKLVSIKQIVPSSDHQITIDTKGGSFEQNIARDFIARDAVTKNTKNITVGNKEVEINPNNIIKTFDEFRGILVQSITQSSNALASISEFAKELTEQLRNRPEVKVCFGLDENISAQELVNKIFIDLLAKNYSLYLYWK
jgi:hypothetical protein